MRVVAVAASVAVLQAAVAPQLEPEAVTVRLGLLAVDMIGLVAGIQGNPRVRAAAVAASLVAGLAARIPHSHLHCTIEAISQLHRLDAFYGDDWLRVRSFG